MSVGIIAVVTTIATTAKTFEFMEIELIWGVELESVVKVTRFVLKINPLIIRKVIYLGTYCPLSDYLRFPYLQLAN